MPINPYMPLSVFASFILTLSVFWAWSFSFFLQYFSENHSENFLMKKILKENASLHLAVKVAQEDALVYSQNVAALLPSISSKEMKGEAGYPLRQLASVTPSGSTKISDLLSENHLIRGKSLFRDGKFDKAVKEFNVFITKTPYSAEVGEAYFLIVESYFRMANYEESTRWVHQMVALFPENELTGHALLRLGKILEIERRPDEAVQVYQTILRSFPQREIASQALESAKTVQF